MFRLTRERQKKGWSKCELSRRTGIFAPDLVNIENGKRHVYPGWRKKIAEAMGLPEEYLFQEVGADD